MRFGSDKPLNPAERYYEFKSKKRQFVWYDKDKSESVPMNLPAHVIVLDTLSCISGYSKKYKSGGFSNEVRNVREDPLSVGVYSGDFDATGLYKDIELQLSKTNGLVIHKSLYVLIKDGNEIILANIKLKGSAMVEWIETVEKKKLDARKFGLVISKDFTQRYTDEKNKENAYFVPVFTPFELTNQDMIDRATEEYHKLQNYFKELKKSSE